MEISLSNETFERQSIEIRRKPISLKQIHAMFEPGTHWEAINTYQPTASGPRTVDRRLSNQIVWKRPELDKPFWMTLPKAAQVIEARDGFLSFKLFSALDEVKYRKPGSIDAVVTLTRVTA